MSVRSAPPATVVYDAECGICSALARRARRLARFVPSSSAAADAQVRAAGARHGITADTYARSVVLYADGRAFTGHRAIAQLLRRGPGALALAGRLLERWPLSAAAALGYALVARHRARISRAFGMHACAPIDHTRDAAR